MENIRFWSYVPYDMHSAYGTVEMLKSYLKMEPRTESIEVPEGYGRVLAGDISSSADRPAQDIARVDGFAVRYEDLATQSHPVHLTMRKSRQPDRLPPRILTGETCSIIAGDCLPHGSDTVLPRESVESNARFIIARSPVEKGACVCRAGTEIKMGSKILSKGTILRTQEISLLSDCQVDRIAVFSRPKVAVLKMSRKPRGASNKTTLTVTRVVAGLANEAGGTSLIIENTAHDSQGAADAFATALENADIVVVVKPPLGEQPQAVETTISSLGKPGLVVRGIRIEHGKSMGFGAVGGKPIIIMPDDVVGALNAFVVLVYPAIRNLLGRSFEEPPHVLATLNTDWEVDDKFSRFTKVVYLNLWTGPDGFVTEPVLQDAENISSIIKANSYLIVPEALLSLKKGTKVWVYLLPGFSYLGARFL